MIDFLMVDLSLWHWSFLGLVLLGVEVFIPGSFLIWIGCAALLTAILTYLFNFMFIGQVISFAVLSILCVAVGAQIYRSRKTSQEKTTLNRKTEQMMGIRFKLSDPIIDGVGHTTIGDSRWRVMGEDLPAGSEVNVMDIKGNSLVIEKVDPLAK
ncbi:MAG: NfeD family protein [Candidatus Paracaedibacteraceae bacterium]|nr:NfeD family protein [Candidatus Paracaedibacteraceae bacterium]